MRTLTADTPIVIFGDDWRRHISTLQHLFAHIVSDRTVVWVNSFGHRAPKLTLYDIRRAISKLQSMAWGPAVPESGSAPTRVIEPKALPWHNLAVVRSLNTWSLMRDIRLALREVAPGLRPVLITGTPAAAGVVGSLDEIASVYFVMDDYGELPGVDKGIVGPLERAVLQKVDAVVATASALMELKRPASGRSYQLPQGVNYDQFSTPQPVPGELAALPRPIVGFAGGVGSACDMGIIDALAAAYPDGSLALLGPMQPDVRVPRRPNIHLLGSRPYENLPAYVQAFDVGIIPYVLNDWTRSVDPLKLLEYLAAGIPVVTTGLPEVFKYRDAIRVADGPAAFVLAVAAALDERSDRGRREMRRAVARSNTWDVRAARLLGIIDEVATARARSLEVP